MAPRHIGQIACPNTTINNSIGQPTSWQHGTQSASPNFYGGEPTTSAHTRKPEHTNASHGQQNGVLDTRVIKRRPWHTRHLGFTVRLSRNKTLSINVLFVALTASTAAGMAYGPTTILKSAPQPSVAAEIRSLSRHIGPGRSLGTLVKSLVQTQQSATQLASLLHRDSDEMNLARIYPSWGLPVVQEPYAFTKNTTIVWSYT